MPNQNGSQLSSDGTFIAVPSRKYPYKEVIQARADHTMSIKEQKSPGLKQSHVDLGKMLSRESRVITKKLVIPTKEDLLE